MRVNSLNYYDNIHIAILFILTYNYSDEETKMSTRFYRKKVAQKLFMLLSLKELNVMDRRFIFSDEEQLCCRANDLIQVARRVVVNIILFTADNICVCD